MNTRLLLIQHPASSLDLEQVQIIERHFAGLELIALIHGDFAAPMPVIRHDGFDDLGAVDRALGDGTFEVLVALYGFSREQTLPLPWIRALASRTVTDVVRLEVEADGRVRVAPHRPLLGRRSRVLSVFPGPIVPTLMGSHQRAFGVLAALNAAGIYTDALITGANADVLDRATALLSQVCPAVHGYEPLRRRLPPVLRMRRGLEQRYRKLRGISGTVPDLFEERLANKSFAAKGPLRDLLGRADYRHVIVNYAWMEPVRELVPPERRASIQWLCDTHDVQFVRGRTNNAGEIRLGVFPEREQVLELRVLRSFDRVIAISEADANVLERHLPGKVVLAPTGFDHAKAAAGDLDPEAPRFGFIGTRMDANVKALRLLLTEWWPGIVKRWPRATLRIAGTACNVPAIRDAAFLRPDVRLEGVVPALGAFYESIDVLLNPVVVRGGLNFKSIEALMSGRLLMTNRLGAECVGDDALCTIAEEPHQVVAALSEALADPVRFRNARLEDQARAQERFGDEAAYGALLAALKERPDGATPRVSSSQVVLLQAGDHLENWRRVWPLADAVRRRGHWPVVLLYRRDGLPYFLSRGIDAVCLYDFDETSVEKAGRRARLATITSATRSYRGFDLADLTALDRSGSEDWTRREERRLLAQVTRHVDRLLRLLEQVRPDAIFVWNGYTGHVANVLRQYTAQRALPRAFMERSLFRDGVFVDLGGTNGESRLAHASADELAATAPARPLPRMIADVCREVPEEELETLRQAGPWRGAERIVFVPLQVQKDTNLVLHSPVIKDMASLVRRAIEIARLEGALVVVRPHPEEVESVELPAEGGYFCDARGDLAAWLQLADHVVTVNSTVGLEALLRGKRVTALGRAIYTAKGMTDGSPPPRELVETYFGVLLDRHTALPGHDPALLAEILPEVSQSPVQPRNPLALDPVRLGESWAKRRTELQRAIHEAGRLTVVVHVGARARVNLDYRHDSVPLDVSWIVGQARAQLGLEEQVDVEVLRPDVARRRGTSDIPTLAVTADGAALEALSLDCYLAPWPEALAAGP